MLIIKYHYDAMDYQYNIYFVVKKDELKHLKH